MTDFDTPIALLDAGEPVAFTIEFDGGNGWRPLQDLVAPNYSGPLITWPTLDEAIARVPNASTPEDLIYRIRNTKTNEIVWDTESDLPAASDFQLISVDLIDKDKSVYPSIRNGPGLITTQANEEDDA